MIRISILSFIIVSVLGRCGRCDPNLDFSFDKKHQQYLAPYKQGDTIFFSNEYGMKDTVFISEIKSWTSNCEWQATSINIKHLPNNKWIDGYEGRNNGKSLPIDQTLIQVDKMVSERSYSVSLSYRDFYGTIEDVSEIKYDSLFNYCNQNKYIVITDKHSEVEKFKNDPFHVMKLFWTDKYGLTGYELRNGEIFKIIQ
jgi:hypothetical protein